MKGSNMLPRAGRRGRQGWIVAALAGGALVFSPPALTAQGVGGPDSVVEIPTIFEEYRILVRPVTEAGDTLVFYTDTGGGMNMLYEPAADRLRLAREPFALGPDTVGVTPWPTWRADAWIPAAMDRGGPLDGVLAVVPFMPQAAMMQDSTDAGFLGGRWFADRVWTFDYPGERLLLRPDGDVPEHEAERRVPLGFQVDEAGGRTSHFPRIRVAVAGDSLDLLFDTGATMVLTDAALDEIGDGGPARRSSSFLSAVVFDRWRAEHPEWRVIERATSFEADLIEVPSITIAGFDTGPVWFERRPEGTFEGYMTQWMDQPIVGALGGNALRRFRVTADYPNAIAVFEVPEG